MFSKIKVYNMFKMLFGKVNHTACFATLAYPLHNNRFVGRIIQPLLER